jgi:MFS family permease
VAPPGGRLAFRRDPRHVHGSGRSPRIGIRGLITGSIALYAACFASWIVLQDPTLIIATRVVTGFAFAGLWVGSVLTMAVLLPPRLQATGQGLYQLTGFGIAAIVANIFGGLLYGAFGAPVVFAIATLLAVVAGLIAVVVFPRTGETVAREEDFERRLPFPATPV